MSEIQSLTDRAESLSQAVDWWNTAMIWALIFVALAAIAVVATTRLAITNAKQLSDAQNELMRAKDRQLAVDLAEKDRLIAEAKLETERIRERISPRTLSREKREKLVAALKGKISSVNVLMLSETEPNGFAAEIISVLEHEAGIEVTPISFPHKLPLFSGLVLFCDISVGNKLALFVRTFQSLGVDISWGGPLHGYITQPGFGFEELVAIPANEFTLYVGPKP